MEREFGKSVEREKRSWKCLNMTVFTQRTLSFNLEVTEKTVGLENIYQSTTD